MERGRPRAFDKDAALEKALVVFWKNGYHASSITELTQAMGINKPSLYAAYGDKEALYLRALALYKERWVARHMQALDTKEDPVEAVLAFLRSVVTMLTDPQLPDGCFVVNGVTGCGSVAMSSAVNDSLAGAVEGSVERLRERLRSDCKAGLLPGVDANAMADYLATVMMGLAVMAKAGSPRERLRRTVNQAVPVFKGHY